MPFPSVGRPAIANGKAGAGKTRFARLALLRQEIGAQTVDRGANRAEVAHRRRTERTDVVGEDQETRMMDRSIAQKSLQAPRHRLEDVAQALTDRFGCRWPREIPAPA